MFIILPKSVVIFIGLALKPPFYTQAKERSKLRQYRFCYSLCRRGILAGDQVAVANGI
jgi:hypothetical protein